MTFTWYCHYHSLVFRFFIYISITWTTKAIDSEFLSPFFWLLYFLSERPCSVDVAGAAVAVVTAVAAAVYLFTFVGVVVSSLFLSFSLSLSFSLLGCLPTTSCCGPPICQTVEFSKKPKPATKQNETHESHSHSIKASAIFYIHPVSLAINEMFKLPRLFLLRNSHPVFWRSKTELKLLNCKSLFKVKIASKCSVRFASQGRFLPVFF